MPVLLGTKQGMEMLQRLISVRYEYLTFMTDLRGACFTAFGTIGIKGPSMKVLLLFPLTPEEKKAQRHELTKFSEPESEGIPPQAAKVQSSHPNHSRAEVPAYSGKGDEGIPRGMGLVA